MIHHLIISSILWNRISSYYNAIILTFQIQRELNGWGLSLANELVQCQASCIADTIQIVAGSRTFAIRNNDWTRDLDSKFLSFFKIFFLWNFKIQQGSLVPTFIHFLNPSSVSRFLLNFLYFISRGCDGSNCYAQKVGRICSSRRTVSQSSKLYKGNADVWKEPIVWYSGTNVVSISSPFTVLFRCPQG